MFFSVETHPYGTTACLILGYTVYVIRMLKHKRDERPKWEKFSLNFIFQKSTVWHTQIFLLVPSAETVEENSSHWCQLGFFFVNYFYIFFVSYSGLNSLCSIAWDTQTLPSSFCCLESVIWFLFLSPFVSNLVNHPLSHLCNCANKNLNKIILRGLKFMSYNCVKIVSRSGWKNKIFFTAWPKNSSLTSESQTVLSPYI